jgi:hypothetical protein
MKEVVCQLQQNFPSPSQPFVRTQLCCRSLVACRAGQTLQGRAGRIYLAGQVALQGGTDPRPQNSRKFWSLLPPVFQRATLIEQYAGVWAFTQPLAIPLVGDPLLRMVVAKLRDGSLWVSPRRSCKCRKVQRLAEREDPSFTHSILSSAASQPHRTHGRGCRGPARPGQRRSHSCAEQQPGTLVSFLTEETSV